MQKTAVFADKVAVEEEMPVGDRWTARSLYEQLAQTVDMHGARPAVSFQLKSGPKDKKVTLTWRELKADVTRAANLFHNLGIGPKDVVAYLLPNGIEAPFVMLAGATAGIVNPINPIISSEHIAGILRETRAKVVVTLAPFPKTDLAQTVADAVAMAPDVETVLQVDLARYLGAPLGWIVPFIRPKIDVRHKAKVLDLYAEMARYNHEFLDFKETLDDRMCAYFHTGGTTGLPKVAQHRASGILYNGWIGSSHLFTEDDTMLCPLPMFHVLAAYPAYMSALMSGCHVVFPTPQGYRGEGVMDNFWKLVERYRATFMITVPTAAAALLQRPVNADVSTLRLAISGSAAMPQEVFSRFEEATGVKILEGYGMTEATCLVSINPPFGTRKVGSVGFSFPYTDVRILHCESGGKIQRECGTDEVGEICVKNPGVNEQVYTDPVRNREVLTEDGYLRTGDLGRIDSDNYIWITGRAKDLIIRGGHNIDPATIEEAFMKHPDVAFAGAIGQPDRHSGEVPAVYVELSDGANATVDELIQHANGEVQERAAFPRHVEILDELPKTAVGKIFKPALRRLAIARTFDYALKKEGSKVRVLGVEEDTRLGLVAVVSGGADAADDEAAEHILNSFTVPWRRQTAEEAAASTEEQAG
ncbi:acyl-CoA synthetase [Amaricoccus tamworthensis]|uniref:acyl-CoA synthetase n=1 Tax=Amaricoccus tamworthensis TaxID=57002 RepID=UPI003C7AE661